MAGRVFFRDQARHLSRHVHSFEAPSDLWPTLVRLTGKRITRQEFMLLVRAIAIAQAEDETHTKGGATRKDAMAQLKAMLRLEEGDALLQALRGCDRLTYEAVQQAQIDAISEILWRDGFFVDADGDEHRIAPSMELGVQGGESKRVPPYLPMGFAGVRNAVAAALKNIEADEWGEESSPDLHLVTMRTRFHPKMRAGRAAKPYQLDLAHACWALWERHGPSKGRGAWRTNGTNKRSKLVDMADVVFSAAGMRLDSSRLVALLKKSK
ncbi:MAG: hypothetical protein M0R28_08265 [Pigmentiphaga sp.]|nr:hypothetical protein [Pigmentiphaga sp.]